MESPNTLQCTHPMELIVDSVDWMKLYFFINFFIFSLPFIFPPALTNLFIFSFSVIFSQLSLFLLAAFPSLFSSCSSFYFSACSFFSCCFSCYFFFFFTCVGTFSLEQERDSKKHCSLFQGVDNFSFKQYHNAM